MSTTPSRAWLVFIPSVRGCIAAKITKRRTKSCQVDRAVNLCAGSYMQREAMQMSYIDRAKGDSSRRSARMMHSSETSLAENS